MMQGETANILPNNKPDKLVIFLLFIGALFVRILPLSFGTETTDILLYKQQASPILQMHNIYYVTRAVFPYTPISMFYPAFCYKLSDFTSVPFHIVIKLFAIFSDVGIVLMLYIMGTHFFRKKQALFCAILYALNPASILISSFQGNIMPLTVFLMLASYFYFSIDCQKNLAISGLLLGLAVGWRSFPILLLPLFLVSMRGLPLRKFIQFTAYVILPSLLSLLPFWLIDSKSLWREIVGYNGGLMHHGSFAIMRGLWLLPFRQDQIPFLNHTELTRFFPYSKMIFLAMYGIVVLLLRKVSLLNKILVTFFSFYVMYAGVASQYLIWVLPFLLLLRRKELFYGYVVITAYALIAFYLTFIQDILFGNLKVPKLDYFFFLHQYVFSEVLFTMTCVICLLVLSLWNGLPENAPKKEAWLCRLL